MVIKGVATLIYVAKSHNQTNGSPIELTKEKEVKVDVVQTFSTGYYFERGREMRDSCNLCVNVYHTEDFEEDGLVYELQYLWFRGMKYKVMAILNNFRNRQNDPFTKLLDCRKVTNA